MRIEKSGDIVIATDEEALALMHVCKSIREKGVIREVDGALFPLLQAWFATIEGRWGHVPAQLLLSASTVFPLYAYKAVAEHYIAKQPKHDCYGQNCDTCRQAYVAHEGWTVEQEGTKEEDRLTIPD